MIFTVFKLVHPWNTLFLIELTPDGIVMDVNDSHRQNAYGPIDATDYGIFIDVRFLQLLKALGPINVRFDDVKFTVFKLVHP